ncbi:MAG: GHMP kinase [Candidatus Thermoplasmatota archaeon]|nr:GHMP kinase [Euryarchaeota archaeon]MBU4031740.1 GHMP kinase [Candidatus Thermoplasmatota archaeon]MBU4071502.1 GHMP kinase [Candidatus Thermoplasmatota archaeon]MBU4143423.1 GHMP kinase [Candidatus Thermoplasmatota archaeon]MBU4592452.1 GHMP kinase [Candidatus Thermoplasmatota archaeon]
MTIISRSPVRISFGGGGTDLASYYEKYGGVVVSAAINKYFYTILEIRLDDRIQIISSDLQLNQTVSDAYHLKFGEGLDIPVAVLKHFNVQRGLNLFMASEIPPGTGLGSSGAVTVNIINTINALERLKLTKQDMAELAYKIEFQELGLPIGKQDEYASAFGGVNFIKFNTDGTAEVEPLNIPREVRVRMESDVMLFFTGRTRESSKILKSQDKSTKDESGGVVDSLHSIKKLAFEVKKAIESGDLVEFGKLLDISWQAKKNLATGITNPRVDKIYDLAKQNGALGGKLTGAGGGGYIMLYCEKAYQKAVTKALLKEGLSPLDFHFDKKGASIING